MIDLPLTPSCRSGQPLAEPAPNNAVELHGKEFRRALGCFPTGVAIITTTSASGAPIGLTCNSFSSVSLDPPLVLWSLRQTSRMYAAFHCANTFAINVLAKDQQALAARFASSIENRFDAIAYSQGELMVPIVEACIARFECSMFARHEAGDHAVFIGQVHSFDSLPTQEPLVFHDGAYKALA
jgi:flavin reductase (DIM6/NTAB) family NADH-FMN oxidoreductase RutF